MCEYLFTYNIPCEYLCQRIFTIKACEGDLPRSQKQYIACEFLFTTQIACEYYTQLQCKDKRRGLEGQYSVVIHHIFSFLLFKRDDNGDMLVPKKRETM